MDLSRYTALFLADSRDHLRRSGTLLLEWERRPGSLEPVPELFRAFHSLKSAAATMGLQPVADLAHRAENLLEAVRQQELSPSGAVIGLLFRAVDALERGIEPALRGEPVAEAESVAAAIERMTASATPSTVKSERPDTAPAQAERTAAERRAFRAVRVDPARLDELLQQAGELVVARNRLIALSNAGAEPELEAVAGQIDSLVRTLHGGVLRARLAPVAELFGRFPRVVRDLGVELGKSARLELRGEGIELDRTMLEELTDPLIHVMRNAVDHGIEPATERIAAGKPAEGRLVLSAERLRDWVEIRVADDGRGIDRAAVSRRAEELGQTSEPLALLDDGQLLSMLARPGFSLKRKVTTVSGRGVGMDAVVTKVRMLGGRVAIHSEFGAGTTVDITVPLTTAIQRVLLVEAAGERYAIPFRLVREAAVPRRHEHMTITSSSGISFRGRPLPLVDLRRAIHAAPSPDPGRRPVLVLEWGADAGALAVDGLLGQHDVLLERVEAPVGLPAWISGATILADGAPAFVLDPTVFF